MKITTRTQYGTRILLDLAIHQSEKPISLKDIARRQNIPQPYLAHLISPLITADMARRTRGLKGGVSLSRPPQSIIMSEVIQIFEGSLAPVECIDFPKLCPRFETCVTRDVWEEMKIALNKVLESITLQNLVERQKVKEAPEETMYYI
jgi:Rrf2 family transcriptional regulator, cysteine metabolism repressor